MRAKKMRIRDKFEQSNLGNFELLYPPCTNTEVEGNEMLNKYDMLLEASMGLW